MSDERAEIAALAADLRAHLESASVRGTLVEPADLPPPAEVAPPAPPPAPSREVALAAASAWERIAAESRQEEGGERGARGLERVRAELGDCRRCPLAKGRRSIVFGEGDPEADLVVVGEGPGAQEDQTGRPFVGEAGAMLDKQLQNVLGLPRERVYIVNVVKCRPPNNRDPAPEEVGACLPFLERQILAVQPRAILVLGRVALVALFGASEGIQRARGIWREWRGIPALPTFHPAFLLRQPDAKRLVFEDLKALRARYDALGGRRTP